MSRFIILSIFLHSVLCIAVAFSNRSTFKSEKKIEVYKVSLAPYPQPKILGTPGPLGEAGEMAPVPGVVKEEKAVEKAPPTGKNATVSKEGVPKGKAGNKGSSKPGFPDGLPDIKPQIYTGSGRGFTYSYYLNILLSKIGDNWNNPFEGKDIVLKAIIYFEVEKSGTISNVRIEEDSGNEIYNESAMRSITQTKKLPPLPKEFSDDYLKVHLEFLTAQ
jgi:protein TonB